MLYTCKRCGYTTYNLGNFKKHVSKEKQRENDRNNKALYRQQNRELINERARAEYAYQRERQKNALAMLQKTDANSERIPNRKNPVRYCPACNECLMSKHFSRHLISAKHQKKCVQIGG